MTIDIEQIERAARAATPGPWNHAACRDHPEAHHSLSCWKVRDSSGEVVGSHEDRDYIAIANPSTVLSLLTDLKRLRAEAEWVACSEVLPRDGQRVLVHIPNVRDFSAHYSSLGGGSRWLWEFGGDPSPSLSGTYLVQPIHKWRPLPQPPAAQSGGE